MSLESRILQGYAYAHDVFAQWGLDIDKAIEESLRVPISMHCWQGDDFHGLEGGGELTGGIAVTGNAPGCPRNVEELRADIEKALSMIPGETKLNLHANYAQTNGRKTGPRRVYHRRFRGLGGVCQKTPPWVGFQSYVFFLMV